MISANCFVDVIGFFCLADTIAFEIIDALFSSPKFFKIENNSFSGKSNINYLLFILLFTIVSAVNDIVFVRELFIRISSGPSVINENPR